MLKIILFLLFTMFANHVHATPQFLNSEKSFAEEYKDLRILLEKIKDTHSANKYKQKIENEILRLSKTQSSGAEYFNSLSDSEKKLFVKRFQKNRFHCSEVTQVMQERRRILFDPKLSLILSETLAKIP